jgi:CTP synthase
LAVSSSIPVENIISAPDVDSIYDIPLNFEKDKLSDTLLKLLHTKPKQTDLQDWRAFAEKSKAVSDEVKIGVVGKYFKTGDFVLSDVYISVIESLKHAAVANNKKLKLEWLDSGEYEDDPKKISELKTYDGILVPGGFGSRGIEGKIAAIKYCRENKIPYFGLCYGMQLLAIEYARNVLGLKDAHTTEVDPKTKYPVIDVMPEQKEKIARGDMGGSMRLGAYPCVLKEGTIAAKAYLKAEISERHRHRYEVNPEFIERLSDEKDGLIFSGTSPDGRLMEIAELSAKTHPFMLGTQFHPEFKSTPLNPHPLFIAFVKAASKK